MADQKDKGKGKMVEKPFRPRDTTKHKIGIQIKEVEEVHVTSSDSEYEDCVEEATPISTRPYVASKKEAICDSSSSVSHYSKDAVKQTIHVRSALEELKENGADVWQISLLASCCPKTCEEAYERIPSLKGKKNRIEKSLKSALVALATFKVKDPRLLYNSEATDSLISVKMKDSMLRRQESFRRDFERRCLDVRNGMEKLKENGVTEWEIVLLEILCPKTNEEAYAIIPSLKNKKYFIETSLKYALASLAALSSL